MFGDCEHTGGLNGRWLRAALREVAPSVEWEIFHCSDSRCCEVHGYVFAGCIEVNVAAESRCEFDPSFGALDIANFGKFTWGEEGIRYYGDGEAEVKRHLRARVSEAVARARANREWWFANGYAEYLRSEHWRKVRNKALVRDGFRCAACGTNRNLEVHHLTYARLGNEDDLDLITLCRQHHGLAEGK